MTRVKHRLLSVNDDSEGDQWRNERSRHGNDFSMFGKYLVKYLSNNELNIFGLLENTLKSPVF